MVLSNDLISQFVKNTKDDTKPKTETTVYGEVVVYNDATYVKMDGSELLTPFSTTADVKDGDRVTVTIKNHAAVITGNTTSPSINMESTVSNPDGTKTKISEFGTLIADKVSVKELEAEVARIGALEANSADIKGKLTAAEADIETLKAEDVKINNTLTAHKAVIDGLDAKYATIEKLEADYATIENLNAAEAKISTLETDKASVKELEATEARINTLMADKVNTKDLEADYANIDFANIGEAALQKIFATTGLITDLTISEGTVAGKLSAVTIHGDLIEGGTIVADKLLVKGEGGLYYKLNTDGITVEAEQTEFNSLNGEVILTQSITASKIVVDDLKAFDATIGSFKIGDVSIYSGVKSTVDNTTRGIYLDTDGQMSVGDSNYFIKFYKDADNTYKTSIATDLLQLGSTNGLVIGDMTSGSLGNNLLISPTNISIRDGSTVSASFTENLIELGQHNTKSKINLCGDKGVISINGYGVDDEVLDIKSTGLLRVSAEDKLMICGYSYDDSLYSTILTFGRSTDGSGNPTAGYIEMMTISGDIRASKYNELSLNINGIDIYSELGDLKLKSSVDVEINAGDCFSVYSDNFSINNNSASFIGLINGISINGRQYGANEVLWYSSNNTNANSDDGLWHMASADTITLSQAVLSQPNGIVLCFTPSDYLSSRISYFFIPKWQVTNFGGQGLLVGSTNAAYNSNYTWMKFLFINDTTIKGHSNNTNSGTGTNGIVYNNNSYVLRAVIGV